ncbi:MAG: type II secretion system protein [Phycisphaerales bacterium]|nr:type II secretion system protein [Phycisphaerales bacterium]
MDSTHAARRAFTLVEMLVVVGIIGLLVAMAVVVGTKVIEGGRANASADLLRVLDQSRSAWQLNADQPLPEFLEVAEQGGKSTRYFPLIDARLATNKDFTAPATPSVVYYTALVLQDASIAPMFEQIDSRFVKPSAAPLPDSGGARETWALKALEINDAWGRPVRFVHPTFHGGYGDYWDPKAEKLQTNRDIYPVDVPTSKGPPIRVEYRRSWRPWDPKKEIGKARDTWAGDGDEGMCVGNTPYFYSPGSDGDPGTRDDNVYSTQPRFPVETKGFK